MSRAGERKSSRFAKCGLNQVGAPPLESLPAERYIAVGEIWKWRADNAGQTVNAGRLIFLELWQVAILFFRAREIVSTGKLPALQDQL